MSVEDPRIVRLKLVCRFAAVLETSQVSGTFNAAVVGKD